MWKRPLALIAALALVLAACGGDDAAETTTTTTSATTTTAAPAPAPVDPTSVVDVAVDNDGFTTLVAAIQAAGLVETLEGAGPFTVLAPTNAAFEAAFSALGITADQLLADTDTLTAILTYHVLPLEADSQVVASLDGESVATVNGQSVLVTVSGDSIMVDSGTVVSADLQADNGIVHVIDTVLLPSDIAAALGVAMDEADDDMEAEALGSIVDVAVGTGLFPTLIAAVQAAGLDGVLSGPGPFTVFAPTEEAFAAALDALNLTPEELLADTETLTAILTYHVLGLEATSDIVVTLDGQEVPTVNGANVLVTVGPDGVMVNEANVIQVDVAADNGVIHVIDSVLLPPSN